MVGGTIVFWLVRVAGGVFGRGAFLVTAVAGMAVAAVVVALFTSLPYVLGSLIVTRCRWPQLVVGTCALALSLDLAERIYAYAIVVEESAQNIFITVPLALAFSLWVLLAWGVDAIVRQLADSSGTSRYKWIGALLTALLIGGVGFGAYRTVKDPPPERLPRVAGSEDSTLVQDAQATLLASTNDESLLRVEVPSLDTTAIVSSSSTGRTVSFADGPSRQGTVAYVENWMSDDVHELWIRRLQTSEERVLAKRKGDVLWDKAVGPPALSPGGQHVAITRNPNRRSATEGEGYSGSDRFIGVLEVWNVDNAEVDTLQTGVRSHSLSWLGEKRLVFAREDSAADAQIAPPTSYDTSAAPMVSIADVAENEAVPLLQGTRPLACAGGSTVLVSDGAGTWWKLDVASDTLSPARWPGNWKGPVGCSDNGYVVYWGLPTEGRPQKFAVGPGADRVPGGDLKLAKIGTKRFVTLVRGVHPADQWIRFYPKDRSSRPAKR